MLGMHGQGAEDRHRDEATHGVDPAIGQRDVPDDPVAIERDPTP